MASKKGKPDPLPVQGSVGGRKIFDTTSVLIGAALAVVIIAIAFFALSAQNNLAGQSAQKAPQPAPVPPVQVIANNRLPSDYQLVVKNTKNQEVQLTSILIGNTQYNVTANLSPGEIKSFDISPPDCSTGEYYNCSLVINYISGSGSQEQLPPQELTGNYTAPPQQGQNGSGQGNTSEVQGGTQPEPLDISTDTLAEGTVDLDYGFSLEAVGGTGVYSWSVSGLPPQLGASSNGRITGTAFDAGTYTVHLTLQDGVSTVNRDLPLTIRASPQ